MRKCGNCKRDFPNHLIAELVAANEKGASKFLSCPICALEGFNQLRGERRTRFDGPKAQAMLEEAQKYVETQAKGAAP